MRTKIVGLHIDYTAIRDDGQHRRETLRVLEETPGPKMYRHFGRNIDLVRIGREQGR